MNSKKTTSLDNAMGTFSNMIVEKLETMQNTEWQKPWFTEGQMHTPTNLEGVAYRGVNLLFLMMHTEKEKYTVPVYGTFKALKALSGKKDKNVICINKGSKGFPVIYSRITAVHKETKEKITFDEYKLLDAGEQMNYNLYSSQHVYSVFNIDQTNMAEVRPDLYAKYTTAQAQPVHDDSFQSSAMEKMISLNAWLCPLNFVYNDNAFYSPSKDAITCPLRSQFKDNESFYSTLLHEIGHSTGHDSRLNRLGDYTNEGRGKEELVAELTAALSMCRMGVEKTISRDTIPYVQSWLKSINETPAFIKNVLQDVKKAVAMIEKRLKEVATMETKVAA